MRGAAPRGTRWRAPRAGPRSDRTPPPRWWPRRRRGTAGGSRDPDRRRAARPGPAGQDIGERDKRCRHVAVAEQRGDARDERRVVRAAQRAEDPAVREERSRALRLLLIEERARGADDERTIAGR